MGNSLSESNVRTVFIAGFPDDVKDRELHNIIRLWPGYEGCQMVRKGDRAVVKVIGFAKFSTRAAAISAISLLDGLDFGADNCFVLRASMARKNLSLNGENIFLGAGQGAANHDVARIAGDVGVYPSSEPAGFMSEASMPMGERIMHEENPPCNTLFIGALPGMIDEQSVRAILGTHPGMVNLKHIPSGRGSSIAFVQFEDVESAIAAKESLAKEVSASADISIRVQFAKSELNQPRGSAGTSPPMRIPTIGGAFGLQSPPYFYPGPMHPVAVDPNGVPMVVWSPLPVPTWPHGGMHDEFQ